MDGDQTAKTFEQGANSAMKGGSDLAEGVHESTKQIVSPSFLQLFQLPRPHQHPTRINTLNFRTNTLLLLQQPAAGDKTTGAGTSVFSKDGAVGSMFNGQSMTNTLPIRQFSKVEGGSAYYSL